MSQLGGSHGSNSQLSAADLPIDQRALIGFALFTDIGDGALTSSDRRPRPPASRPKGDLLTQARGLQSGPHPISDTANLGGITWL